ncbi:HNH endonuclease [Williamsia muralis]
MGRVSTRRQWSDEYVDAFCDQAHQLGLSVPRGAVTELIDDHVRLVATRLGITVKTARSTFSIDDAHALARQAAEPFTHEHPGHDLLDLPITHTIPMALAARTIAGLAITAELAGTAAGPHRDDVLAAVREPHALISAWALLIERAALTAHTTHLDTTHLYTSDIALPEAAIHRALRHLDRGLHHLAAGITTLDGGDPHLLTEALTRNHTALHNEL